MTPLAALLARRIQAEGPLSIAQYMAECLLHPEHGYYATRDPLGAQGDFTTAPEISQMFGELLGLALAQSWINQGCPAPFVLAEPGPGRGTLMADIMRATAGVPGFREAARVQLIEASPVLREKQRATLAGAGITEITWLDRVDQLPEMPLFLIANEFFDALPVRQFTRDEKGWREHQVALAEGALCLALSTPAPIAALDHRLGDTRPGDIVELCPAAAPIIGDIARRIGEHGGAAIIIDYGGWHSLGDTLQAVRNHAPEPVLAAPGQADLTAHVDFEALAQAARLARRSGPITQGTLLQRLGISQRAAQLAERLEGAALDSHVAALQRLTAPEEMGNLFKAIAFVREGSAPVPGFDP